MSEAEAPGVEGEDVWALWRRLKRFFPTWSLPPSAFYTPGAWTMIGVDFTSGLRRNRSTRETFALLEGVSDPDIDALTALAAVNHRRQLQVMRAVIIAYVTVPLSLVATAGEIAPERVERLIQANADDAMILFFGLTFGALTYVASWWRSRQILDVLDLLRIERRHKPYTALELREGD